MQKKCAFVLSLLVVAMTLPCQAQPASEQEKNKTVARVFFEEVLGNQGNLERYADFHTADYVGHGSKGDFTLAEDLAAARDMRKALPDMQNAVNHMVAEGDLLLVHWTLSGTNTQAGWGLPGTGKPVKISGMTLFRFKAGKISEEWNAYSILGVLKEAGLYPPKPCTAPVVDKP
ncbi:MAG: ester cyclase [Candidatus Sulfotelmatobacter sp.]